MGRLDDDDEGPIAKTRKRAKGRLWIELSRYYPIKVSRGEEVIADAPMWRF